MLWNHQFGGKYGPRGPPRAIYEPGGSGCRTDTYCIERVKITSLYWFQVVKDYADVADFIIIYIAEAHPIDGMFVHNKKKQITSHRSIGKGQFLQ